MRRVTRRLTAALHQGVYRLWRFRHSVRFRLTLWSVVILGLVLIVFSGFVVLTQLHVFRVEAENQLQIQGQRLASRYDPASGQVRLPLFGALSAPLLPAHGIVLVVNGQGDIVQKIGVIDEADAQRLVGNVLPQPGSLSLKVKRINFAAITQLAGAFLKGRVLDLFTTALKQAEAVVMTRLNGLPFSAEFTLTDPPAADVSSHYLIYAAPVLLKDNTFFGTLIVGQPLDFGAQIQRLIGVLLLAMPATLLVALIGGYWLASRAMRPVQRITQTARTISETDLSRRLNLDTPDEIGELAQTFDQMLERLQTAFARQRQFTADASHELRTPLTIVNLEVDRALAHQRTPQEYERALAIISAETSTMNRLVNNLLFLARADAGQTVIQQAEVELSELTLDVVERLIPLARKNGVELMTGDLPELTLCGDRAYLAQMLTNLIENAIKYTAGVGQHVWIEAECQSIAHAPWGGVRIKDDGPGIAAEHLPRVFDRFYRADKARTSIQMEAVDDEMPAGSGLGLSIVLWVAQSHGGAVRVHSEVGHGAIFEVWLPLSKNVPSLIDDRPRTEKENAED